MQTEFGWGTFPRLTTWGILEEIQKLMKSFQCEPAHFNGRDGNIEECIPNSIEVSNYARRFPCCVILGAWIRKEMVQDLF